MVVFETIVKWDVRLDWDSLEKQCLSTNMNGVRVWPSLSAWR